MIGDRRTCALLDTDASLVWYCPRRFDKAAWATVLIDPDKGGYWKFNCKGKQFTGREYHGRSGILTTHFDGFDVTDMMPIHDGHKGIVRDFSKAPVDLTHDIFLKPAYGIGLPEYELDAERNEVIISRTLHLTASHPLRIEDGHIHFTIPKGEEGWAVLLDEAPKKPITRKDIESWREATSDAWKDIAGKIEYEGIMEDQVHASLRAIQLLTYEENGGIIAAATTSLPEVIGGERNYDYRYVWLRDTAMIVGALIRADSNGEEARKFLSFLCDAKYRNSQKILLPFYSLDKLVAQPEEELPLAGYRGSTPTRIGNNAMDQLQLDANANVLFAAKLVYERYGERDHWETVSAIADHLAERWKEKDHGIWEEHIQEHFTSSKVIVAKGLEFVAEHSEDPKQAKRWKDEAKQIRKYITDNCLTSSGAFATYAGSDRVDITASLYPVWLFTEPDSPEMLQTIKELEEHHREGDLYRRTLELFDASKEGVFLAGSLWMAQYQIMAGDLDKAQRIIDAVLAFSNDLGFFSEEGDPGTGEMLGNFPQTFVHASFIGVMLDMNKQQQHP